MGMLFGTAVPASTRRLGTPQLETITLRAPLGRLLQPENPQTLLQQFGEMAFNTFSLHCEWPAGSTDDLPIQAADAILIDPGSPLAAGKTYEVWQVQPHFGLFIKLYVQVKQS